MVNRSPGPEIERALFAVLERLIGRSKPAGRRGLAARPSVGAPANTLDFRSGEDLQRELAGRAGALEQRSRDWWARTPAGDRDLALTRRAVEALEAEVLTAVARAPRKR